MDGPPAKVTVISCQALSDVHRHVLRLLRQCRETEVEVLTVYTAVSEVRVSRSTL